MERNFTVNEIITILLKRLWLIVTMALIGGIIAFSYSQYVLPKKYTAKVALYVYNEKTYSLIGEHTKKVYKIGDEVKVKLVKADMEIKKIDFVVI